MAFLSVASLASGTAVSCFADHLPIPAPRAELLGGLMLVFGLCVIGCGLSPLVHG